VAQVEIETIEGLGGADVTVENHPFTVTPGYPAVLARSKQVSYRDHGFEWEISGKNGWKAHFAYQVEG
jgi:hypothetical protein